MRAYLIGGCLLAVLAFSYWAGSALYDAGYQKRIAEEAAATREKTNASNTADDAARRCAADPDCRLRSDPYERR